MAGSIKWFKYETDAGQEFAVRMDESNGEAVGNPDYAAGDSILFALPRNIEARYVRYTSDDGLYTRKIIVSDPAASAGTLPSTITAQVAGSAAGVTLSLAAYVGERYSAIPQAADTGLLDGDPT